MARLPWQRTVPAEPMAPGPGPSADAETAKLGELVARVADHDRDRTGDRKDQLAALTRGLAGAARGATGQGTSTCSADSTRTTSASASPRRTSSS